MQGRRSADGVVLPAAAVEYVRLVNEPKLSLAKQHIRTWLLRAEDDLLAANDDTRLEPRAKHSADFTMVEWFGGSSPVEGMAGDRARAASRYDSEPGRRGARGLPIGRRVPQAPRLRQHDSSLRRRKVQIVIPRRSPGPFIAGREVRQNIAKSAPRAPRLLSVCEKILWGLTAPRGPIPCVRIGRAVRYSVEDLRAWINRGRGEGGHCGR